MYKKAGLTSKTEAIKRMASGEVFYKFDRSVKFYMVVGDKVEKVRFVLEVKQDGCIDDIRGYWEYIESWIVKVRWEDSLKDSPTLCWVSDISEDNRSVAARVVSEGNGGRHYVDTGGCNWTYATPVHPDECSQER